MESAWEQWILAGLGSGGLVKVGSRGVWDEYSGKIFELNLSIHPSISRIRTIHVQSSRLWHILLIQCSRRVGLFASLRVSCHALTAQDHRTSFLTPTLFANTQIVLC